MRVRTAGILGIISLVMSTRKSWIPALMEMSKLRKTSLHALGTNIELLLAVYSCLF